MPSNPAPGHLFRYEIVGQDAPASFQWVEPVASDNYGTLRITVEDITSFATNTVPNLPPRSVKLLSNYPNPFNPSTTIRYRLPMPAEVRITANDVRGRLLRVIYEGLRPKGTLEAFWDGVGRDGRAAPSGVYYVLLSTSNGSDSKKVTLIK